MFSLAWFLFMTQIQLSLIEINKDWTPITLADTPPLYIINNLIQGITSE